MSVPRASVVLMSSTYFYPLFGFQLGFVILINWREQSVMWGDDRKVPLFIQFTQDSTNMKTDDRTKTEGAPRYAVTLVPLPKKASCYPSTVEITDVFLGTPQRFFLKCALSHFWRMTSSFWGITSNLFVIAGCTTVPFFALIFDIKLLFPETWHHDTLFNTPSDPPPAPISSFF